LTTHHEIQKKEPCQQGYWCASARNRFGLGEEWSKKGFLLGKRGKNLPLAKMGGSAQKE